MSLKTDTEVELMKILMNQRRLRAFLNALPVHHIPSIVENMNVVSKDRLADAERERQAQQARLAKIAEYKELLAADGIELADLIPSGPELYSAGTTKRAPRPAKYEYTDDNGERCTWTGQGRQPVPIREGIARGKTLADFLIR